MRLGNKTLKFLFGIKYVNKYIIMSQSSDMQPIHSIYILPYENACFMGENVFRVLCMYVFLGKNDVNRKNT